MNEVLLHSSIVVFQAISCIRTNRLGILDSDMRAIVIHPFVGGIAVRFVMMMMMMMMAKSLILVQIKRDYFLGWCS